MKYYVHGSFQRIGDEIKVVARLTEADSGAIQAQESVTDRFADIFRVEDELARKFTESLEATAELTRLGTENTSLEAYRALTEARTHYANFRFEEAIAKLRAAVAVDADYAPAWALMSKCYSRMAAPAQFSGGALEELRNLALDSARKAVELDPSLYDAHTALALAYRELRQVEPWRSEAEKATELNPRVGEAYGLIGDTYQSDPAWGCARDRDPVMAERYYREALRLDPRSGPSHNNLVETLRWGGRLQESLQAADEAVRILPETLILRRARAETLLLLDRVSEAEEDMQKIVAARAPVGLELVVLGGIDLRMRRSEIASRRFEEALRMDPSLGIAVALYSAQAGDLERSATQLERVLQSDGICLKFVTGSPLFAEHREKEPLRSLLARYGRRQG